MIIRKHYPKEVHDALLTAYFSGHESGSVLAQRFGVNPETVSVWTTRYKNQYLKLRSESTNNCIFVEEPQSPTKMLQETPTPADLGQRIKQLEQQLEEERMRSRCLDKMIEIAERDLNISISEVAFLSLLLDLPEKKKLSKLMF